MSGEFIPALRFKALTRFYGPVVRLTTRERSVKHALIESAHVPQGATVVDLGCGTGTLTVWLKQQNPSARVIGLDADPAILEFAKAKADVAGVNIEFMESNASDLPFAAGTVDRIVSSLFFHHLQPDMKKRVLSEAFRVLADGGELHISDWGKPANILMRIFFTRFSYLMGYRIPEITFRACYQSLSGKPELERLLSRPILIRCLAHCGCSAQSHKGN